MKDIIESYTTRVNDLQRIHNIGPRKGAAASGEVFEQLVNDVARQYTNLQSLKNDYLTAECGGYKIKNVQVDRHIRKNGIILSVIECKVYFEFSYGKRAVTDFIDIAESPEVNDNVEFVIVAGQENIAENSLKYLQAKCKRYTGRNFKLFLLNEVKKRNPNRPLYREKFSLDLHELKRFNDYIASL